MAYVAVQRQRQRHFEGESLQDSILTRVRECMTLLQFVLEGPLGVHSGRRRCSNN